VKKKLVFKGNDNPGMLRRIEEFRLDVWRRIIDAEVAADRFCLDPFDYDGWHVVHLDQNEIIGSGRLIIAGDHSGVPDLCSFEPYTQHVSYPMGVMNRLVVHHEYTCNGVGGQLSLERIELAREQGVVDIWVEIQGPRMSSMEQMGFQDMGPSHDTAIEGVWRIMRRSI